MNPDQISADDPDVICDRQGVAGVITLNRPRALHALTLPMIRKMRTALDTWEDDPTLTTLIIRSSGGRAFCAGGDIRLMREKAITGYFSQALSFWREEYQLNSRLKRYTKPVIALVDGIVMGGGAGLALPCHYRIGTPSLVFAMPETGIGFFPDVGVSYDLARLPHAVGLWLALTGERLGIDDACYLGLMTHQIPSEAMAGVFHALCETRDVDSVFITVKPEADHAPLKGTLSDIKTFFSAHHLSDVFSKLEQHASTSDFAARTLSHLKTRSPTSLAVTFELLKRAAFLSFEEVLMQDYRLAAHLGRHHDFHEGVRALMIDKDLSPQWNPERLDRINEVDIRSWFDPLSDEKTPLP